MNSTTIQSAVTDSELKTGFFSMLRRKWWLFAALAAVIVGVVIFVRMKNKADVATYETVSVDRGNIVAKVTATGTLSALVTVQVGSQVSGRIKELHADFNSEVHKGEVIAVIDPQIFEASLEQARANLSASQGDLLSSQVRAKDAERQYTRAKSLAERQLIAQADLDTAQANYEAAQAQVQSSQGKVAQAKANYSQAKVNLDYTIIKSPIDGSVVSRSVDVGQTVAASLQAPTIFVLAENLRKMQVDTSVAEADVGKLAPGMRASFTVDAYPNQRFDGTVRQVRNAPQVLQNVVTYDAVVDVDNPELKLKPGMTANVNFVSAEKENVVRIPNSALRFRAPTEWTAKDRPAKSGSGADGTERHAGSGQRRNRTNGAVAGAPPTMPSPAEGTAPANPSAAAGSDTAAPVFDKASRKVVWKLVNNKPEKVSVSVGVTDGSTTEMTEGALHEGDSLITEVLTESGAAKPAGTTPIGGGMGGPGGGMRRMF